MNSVFLREVLDNKSILVMLTEEFNRMKDISNLTELEINKFKSYMVYKIDKQLNQYLALQCLYDIETSSKMIEAIISDRFVNLYKNAVIHSLLSNKSFTDFDAIGSMMSETKTDIGYSGFNITNQDGAFNKQTVSQVNNGLRLQYMMLLDEHTKQIATEITNEIIKKICRSIY